MSMRHLRHTAAVGKLFVCGDADSINAESELSQARYTLHKWDDRVGELSLREARPCIRLLPRPKKILACPLVGLIYPGQEFFKFIRQLLSGDYEPKRVADALKLALR